LISTPTSERSLRAKAVRSWVVQWVGLELFVWPLSGRTCLAQCVHGRRPFLQQLARLSTQYPALMLADTCLTTMEAYMRRGTPTISPSKTLTGSRVLG